ncbi:MAG TPA: hypothetical protein PLQ01_04255 [Methanothrix sp.]|nr:hypothetical protein [Methanothrix sp.]
MISSLAPAPDPINLKEMGVVSVAILDSNDFNVSEIDPSSVTMSRTGVEYVVSPSIRWSLEDVATPFCACHDLNGDGILDIVLKFEAQALVGTLELDKAAGAGIPLTLTGRLNEASGGDQIQGQDCVRVPKNRK